MEMDGEGFLSGILLEGEDGNVASLEDMPIPVTQQSPTTEDLDEVEVVASRGNKGTRRTKNFVWLEDKIVCEGWLYASKDPIHGANQNKSTFWGKVHDYFEKNKTTTIVRTESSILHRWLTIQTQVNKFCSCYEAIDRRNQSGLTIQDKISEAHKMYMGLENGKESKKFNAQSCWTLLKDEDKWKTKRKELLAAEKQASAGNKNKKKSTKVSRPREEEETNNGDAAEMGTRNRGDGVKKAKEKLRRGGGEACLEAIDKMWAKKEVADIEKEKAKNERFMLSFELDKQALEVDKQRADAENTRAAAEETRAAADKTRAEAELIKQEKEIIFADVSSLNTLQREWVEMMQQDIMARRRAI